MKIKTCLRYPGGKFYGFKKIKPYLDTPHDEFVEVFVGGASIFLGKELVKKNWINDKDEELINFYKVISDRTISDKLFSLLKNEIVNKERYKEVLNLKPVNKVERAFKYFYLNRTSFSGIMKNPRWGYLIGSSVTPEKWVGRILPVSEKLQDTKITCLDFREVLSNVSDNALVYLDPPYYKASKNIYSNEFSNEDHYDLMELLKNSKFKFILSYNNHQEIINFYRWGNITNENWVYFMSESRRLDGKELIITNF
jgi:DNA adenine methylase